MSKHNTISQENLKYSYNSGRLPHIFDVDKPIFITFRLKFTLPQAIIREYTKRKRQWQEEQKNRSQAEKLESYRLKEGLFFAWFDQLLDNSCEVPKILHREDITGIIATALKFFDKQRYRLLAYCIMPNHVHALIFPFKDADGNIYSPAGITYSWKRYTANRINKLLDKQGSLWQRESYDRMVRDEDELCRIIEYVLQNPVKAGLVDEWDKWRGNYLCEELGK
jgi:putative transposase